MTLQELNSKIKLTEQELGSLMEAARIALNIQEHAGKAVLELHDLIQANSEMLNKLYLQSIEVAKKPLKKNENN